MERATQMFFLVATCLAALSCTPAAGQTFQCIQCNGEECRTKVTPTNCAAGKNHCITELVVTAGVTSVSKGCAVLADCTRGVCCTANACNIGLPLRCITCNSETACANAQPTYCSNPDESVCFTAVGEADSATYLTKGCGRTFYSNVPSVIVTKCSGDACNAANPLKCVSCTTFQECATRKKEFCGNANDKFCFETTQIDDGARGSASVSVTKGCASVCTPYSKGKSYYNYCCEGDGCNGKELFNAATAPSAGYLAGLSLPLLVAILH